MFVEEGGKGRAGDVEGECGVGHREAVGLDDLVLHEAAGVGGGLHADAGHCAHDGLPVVVLCPTGAPA